VNKAKPFMFWIVCGVVVLLLLISLLFITNAPAGSDGNDPVSINADLDKRFKELDKQHKLAVDANGHAKVPVDIFDPTDLDPSHPNSFDHLLKEYLPTKQWKVVLDAYVDKDKAAAAAIAQWLVLRSQPLHTAIFSESDLSEWYTAHYLVLTHDLMQQLNDAKAIELPDVHQGAPAQPAPSDATPDDNDPLNSAAGRAVAGFFTRGPDLPSTVSGAGGTALLTLHLHIMEQIVAALVKTSATNLPNPLLPNKIQHEDKARLVAIDWLPAVPPPPSSPSAPATPATNFSRYPLRITLEGPTSAVLARRIDGAQSDLYGRRTHRSARGNGDHPLRSGGARLQRHQHCRRHHHGPHGQHAERPIGSRQSPRRSWCSSWCSSWSSGSPGCSGHAGCSQHAW